MHLFSLTCTDFAAALHQGWGKGMFHAAALYRHVFKQGNTDLAAIPELSQAEILKRAIARAFDVSVPAIAALVEQGGVAKIVFSLADGLRVEAVWIPMPRRATLCLSSQVGCRMGCAFCRTGSLGLLRNLRTEEIVGQVFAVRHGLGRAIDNIVFMGMGEPLDNFANVVQAIGVLSDQRGLDIPHSHMTISTAGLTDGIRRLGELGWPGLNLAVSLNAADDELRSQLMPINAIHPLAQLKQTLQGYPLRKKGVFFIEYVLLKGVNDGRGHAARLAGYLEGLPVRVNVIGYNPGPDCQFESPGEKSCTQFCTWLASEGIFVRMRSSRGQCIHAACGQLGGPEADFT
jgi:23S rRNA (adenine2503-C2)-methyltransferase